MRYFILISMLFFASTMWAQDLTFPITGKITNQDNGSKLGGVTISLMKDGKVISSSKTSSNGRYILNGSGSKTGTYQLVYSKPGMVTKKIFFDASKVNEEDLPAGNEVPFPALDIDLFTERENVDFSFLESEPVASFFWSEKKFALDFDRNASAKTKRKIEDLLLKAEKDAAEDDAKYNNAIIAGDMFYSSKEYDKSLEKFKEALGYRPDEDYPAEKIKELNALIKAAEDEAAANEAADLAYDALIKEADGLRDGDQLEAAIGKYEEALNEKDEQYPKDEIIALRKKIEERNKDAANQAKYEAAMADAKNKFDAGNLLAAKSKYMEASELKRSEQLPKDKIKEIDDLLAEQGAEKEKAAKYEAAIKAADALFASEKYELARDKYQEAYDIDDQAYPKSQIAICDKKIEDLLGAADLQTKIDALMAKGNSDLAKENYESAIENYEKVIDLDNGHAEAKNKLKLAQDKLAQIDKEYKDYMTKGDQLVSEQKYLAAIEEYNNALGVKPLEQEPVDKAKEAQRLSEEATSEFDQQYEKLLATADSKADEGEYDRALELVNRAKSFKASDPRQDEILKKIKRNRERDANYEKFMSQGESLASSKQYKDAKLKFESARDTKPEEALPPKRIADMEKIISENATSAEKDELYNEYMADGQSNQNKREFERALSDFQNALTVKPGDVNAQNKIDEIQQILDDIANAETSEKEKQEKFDRLIEEANQFFYDQDYLHAVDKYEAALDLIPDSKYARVQRDESLRLERERSITEEDAVYNKLIDAADQSFDSEDYLKSKEYYTTAVSIRPKDLYPQKRLDEIDAILNPKIVKSDELEDLGTPFSGSIIDGEIALKEADQKRKMEPAYEVVDITKGIEDRERDMTDGKTEDHYDNTNEIYQITSNIIATTKDAEKDLAERATILDGSLVALSEEEKRSAEFEYNENLDASAVVNTINEDAALDYNEREEVYFDNSNIMAEYNIAQEADLKYRTTEKEEANIESDQVLEVIMQDINTGMTDDYAEREAVGRKVGEIQEKYRDADLVANEKEYGTIQETNVVVKTIQMNVDQKFVEDAEIANNNSEELKKVDLQFESDSRMIYNSENEKYLSNHEQILADTDENSEINEIADEAMDKKREYVEAMDERAKFKAGEYQDADDQDRIDARETIDDINAGVTDKAGEENERIAKNGVLVEDIDLAVAAANKNKSSSETDEHRDAKGVIDNIKNEPPKKSVVVNSLGKEYPEGVSQEIFTNQDQNGLMREVITRRIVVKDGHADVYLRTQTMNGITYSKNGKASLEHVWQKETQHPSLERHF